jgi:hypothetical protein
MLMLEWKSQSFKIARSQKSGLYREAQWEGLSARSTIRLWRCSTVGNRPKFPYISYTFTGKLGLVDVHLADVGTDSGLPLCQHFLGPTLPHDLGTAGRQFV